MKNRGAGIEGRWESSGRFLASTQNKDLLVCDKMNCYDDRSRRF